MEQREWLFECSYSYDSRCLCGKKSPLCFAFGSPHTFRNYIKFHWTLFHMGHTHTRLRIHARQSVRCSNCFARRSIDSFSAEQKDENLWHAYQRQMHSRIFLMSTDSIAPSESQSHHTPNIANCFNKEHRPLNARTIASTFTIVPSPKNSPNQRNENERWLWIAPMSMLQKLCGAITNVIECKQLRFGSTVDSFACTNTSFHLGEESVAVLFAQSSARCELALGIFVRWLYGSVCGVHGDIRRVRTKTNTLQGLPLGEVDNMLILVA